MEDCKAVWIRCVWEQAIKLGWRFIHLHILHTEVGVSIISRCTLTPAFSDGHTFYIMFSAVVRQGRRKPCSNLQKRGDLAFAFVVTVIDEGMVELVGNDLFKASGR